MKIIETNSLELISTLRKLKIEDGYDFLADLTAVDYPDFYEIVYHLMSLETAELIKLKIQIEKLCSYLPSIVQLWSAADVMEREIFDMFGLTFIGHPNLRRILNPNDYVVFPLQKKFILDSIDRQSKEVLMKESN